ncbi:MAG: HEPN domain-containing protein [Dehalococcoidia bacterium]|nr:HEPN domain-containing protein [Dehalococcoidia bacterium]
MSKPASDYFLAADEALEEARALWDRNLLKGTVNRAYYAMFYAASAAVVAEGIRLPKSHKTLLNLFYHHFVESGRLQRTFHRDLARTFQLRQQGDYEIHAPMGRERVKEAVDKAEGFVSEIRKIVDLES